jgi:hypothetical protein
MTADIRAQVTAALERGETVRLGRWTAQPVGRRVNIFRHAEESRHGPLVSPTFMGDACPCAQAAHSLVESWLADW